jgi:DNA-nicking Smr family endonuclease
VDESVRFETSDDGAHLEGRRFDVDPKELRRLRRGLFVLDATLDLHGRSAPEARAELAKFVRRHALAGERLVLVIHGRGNHSPGGQAVLRGEIGAWLSQGAAARHVAAFVTAPPEQGGEGAVLVLLDRSRG